MGRYLPGKVVETTLATASFVKISFGSKSLPDPVGPNLSWQFSIESFAIENKFVVST